VLFRRGNAPRSLSFKASRSVDVWKAAAGLETRGALEARRRVSLAAKAVILKRM
jgi:hypothetical protein